MIGHFNILDCLELDVYIQFVKVPQLLWDYLTLDIQHLFQPPAAEKNIKGFQVWNNDKTWRSMKIYLYCILKSILFTNTLNLLFLSSV